MAIPPSQTAKECTTFRWSTRVRLPSRSIRSAFPADTAYLPLEAARTAVGPDYCALLSVAVFCCVRTLRYCRPTEKQKWRQRNPATRRDCNRVHCLYLRVTASPRLPLPPSPLHGRRHWLPEPTS